MELTTLIIGSCEELMEIIVNEGSKNFVPVEVFFPKLNTLKIVRCNKLKSLFSVEKIRALPQLTTLHVSEAAQLKEIFRQSSEEDIVNEVEAVVPNLREIQLEKLQSFLNIYQGFLLHKLKLQKIEINGCPKFTPILGAIQSIPLHIRTEENLVLWPIALRMNQLSRQQMCHVALKAFSSIEFLTLRNSGVEGILELRLMEEEQGGLHHCNASAQNYLNSSLKGLYLSDLPELRFIWSGRTHFLGFDQLTEITVKGCQKLTTIFPAGIVGSLQNLNRLTICNCEELEEICDLQVECFPKINFIEVEKCNKLKCIFYTDCWASHHHTRLQQLNIRRCSQLERIYGLKHITEVNNKDHVEQEVLLDVTRLELESLPNFTEIGPRIKLKKQSFYSYDLRPFRSYHKVEECPKYVQQCPVPNIDSRDGDIAGSSQA